MLFRTIFWGNSSFVLPSLEFLYEKTQLLAIFTGIDKPFGRNQKEIKIPEPKLFGQKKNIPVFQETDLKKPELKKTIEELKPDVMVVISYGKIIPRDLYLIPPFGTINAHASILPLYRGASPIQQALLNGDTETGITIQNINDQVDSGNIVLAKKIKIAEEDNYETLKQKLSLLCVDCLKEFFETLEKGNIQEIPQSEKQASYCHKIHKEDGKIVWQSEDAERIYNKWRAFYVWPQIYAFYQDKQVVFTSIRLIDKNLKTEFLPGQVIQANKEQLWVQTLKGVISVLRIKPANRKEMDFISFINGYKIKKGDFFQ